MGRVASTSCITGSSRRSPGPRSDHADIAAHLRWLHRSFSVAKIAVDPSQALEMIGYLARERLPIVEVPQTAGNVDEMGSTLITAIQSRELVVYSDDAVRQQARDTGDDAFQFDRLPATPPEPASEPAEQAV